MRHATVMTERRSHSPVASRDPSPSPGRRPSATREEGNGETAPEATEAKATGILLRFRVVACSSERNDAPASALCRTAGRWKTANMYNQSVTMELIDGPNTVSTVRLALPGDDSNPRHCAVHYSTKSALGPWTEGWEFEVQSEMCRTLETKHDYDGLVTEYKGLLMEHCGSVEAAWNNLMDVSHDGRLSYPDFVSACDRVRQYIGGPQDAWTWPGNELSLFHAFDSDDSGKICLDDLERTGVFGPHAAWWRLTLHDNWGSLRETQVLAPLKLFSSLRERRWTNIRRRLLAHTRPEDDAEDLVCAFSADRLGLSQDSRRTRELSAKHRLPLATVEHVYETFQKIDVDGSDYLERDEFEALVLKLHGAKSPDELPSSRLRNMWQEADTDGSGAICFERFLLWFSRRLLAGATGVTGKIVSDSVVSNYYSGLIPVKLQDVRAQHTVSDDVLATRRRLLQEAQQRGR